MLGKTHGADRDLVRTRRAAREGVLGCRIGAAGLCRLSVARVPGPVSVDDDLVRTRRVDRDGVHGH